MTEINKTEKKPSYKQRYEELQVDYKILEEDRNNLREALILAQNKLEEFTLNFDNEDTILYENVQKQPSEELLNFSNLMLKYLTHNKESDIYQINIAFKGPKGKKIIRDCINYIKSLN
jgi:hypothetical protein